MKKLSLLLALLSCGAFAYGQTLETSAYFTGGVSRFGGASAAAQSAILVSDVAGVGNYTNNPYGSKYRPNAGAGMQTQLVAGRRFLLGAQLGVEQLRSRVAINQVYGFRSNNEAHGQVTLKSSFLNLQPYLGWRLLQGQTTVDLSLGSDIGFFLKIKEAGEATDAYDNQVEVSQERSKPDKPDVRPRIGLTAYRRHLGLSLSYAQGLTNYMGGYDGANPEVYMRVWRLGLLYRLN